MIRKLPQTICITGEPFVFFTHREEPQSEMGGDIFHALRLCLPASLLLWALIIYGLSNLVH